jgi:hydroxymethylbilane synthase
LRPDLQVVEIRGNMATRLRKLLESDSMDALILARAAIDRLGDGLVSPSLHVSVIEEMLPAPGQGAIGVECREADADTKLLLQAIHHVDTALCVNAERDLLRSLGGGCSLPLGARAVIRDGEVHLIAALFEEGGIRWIAR